MKSADSPRNDMENAESMQLAALMGQNPASLPENAATESAAMDAMAAGVPLRLQSLDVFRGVTVAFMLLVNNPGNWDNIYAPLEHSEWNGCTPTDLVYPFFLFIIGVSSVFSLSRIKENPAEANRIVRKILRRGLTLFLIGIFLSLFPFFDFRTLRIMGVLQRIALVYTGASLLFIYLNKKQLLYTGVALLIGYYLLMVAGPLLLTGSYSLAPGQNVSALIDRAILTNAHMWKPAKTWDPEGLTGTIPAIASALIGIMAGGILYNKEWTGEEKVIRLFTIAFGLIVSGLLAGLAFPINKSLWTSSFVLYAGGIAMAFLAMFYYLIDLRKRNKGLTFFKIFGMNAIVAFTLSGLIPRIINNLPLIRTDDKTVTVTTVIYDTLNEVISPKNASLGYALVNVGFYFTILAVLYTRKIFIKV